MNGSKQSPERSSTPPPGWYPDPDRPAMQRYWDGSAWTEQRMPQPTWGEHRASQAKPEPLNAQALRWVLGGLAVVAVIAAVVISDGGTDSGSKPSAVDRNNAQAQREFRICEQQADQIARTQGADAASEHLDQCVDALANESQVQP